MSDRGRGEAASDRGRSSARGVAVELGDTLAVAGYAVVAGVAILSGVVDGPLRVLLAASLLGFCPGYAVVSVLLPRRTPLPWVERHHSRWRHRIALGLATSLVLLVLAGIALASTGFTTATLVLSATAVSVLGSLIAVLRRLRVPDEERLRLPLGRLRDDARNATTGAPRREAVLNVALAIAVVAGMATLAVGLAAPDRGEAYSEAALVTADGERSAIGNDSYVRGEQATLTLEVENQDAAEQRYTAVVVLERFGAVSGESETARLPPLLERDERTRATLTVPNGETATEPIAFTPSLLGDELRLSVYLYAGDAPERPSAETANTHLYRWVTVNESEASPSIPAPSAPVGG